VYIHVPFCSSRCGYCDFTTYTAEELGPGVSRSDYAASAMAELDVAARVLGPATRAVSSIFVGGGTPTLLSPRDLGSLIVAVEDRFGLVPDVEITVEANPESVDAMALEQLRAAGFTRVSLGMQSAVTPVLQALDRRHTPGRAVAAAQEARAAGFDHINLDLIYGAPGETTEQWGESVESALLAGPDHISAYALIVEDGTRLAAQVARGEVVVADQDTMAERYVMVDSMLTAAGMSWYEVSNWAMPDGYCRHNVSYWHGDDWWGIGPGAHSHIGGVRWWNTRHPAPWAAAVAQGHSPAHAREELTDEQRYDESILLGLRLAGGLSVDMLNPQAKQRAAEAVEQGLIEPAHWGEGRLVLTRTGRLLADRLAVDLLTV
jgi:oxygen-independent coproporphyrinogen-3 oxidase